ncbi:MAG TPA: hypothetical protein PLW02_05345 [Verrucomicrobiota bacterium]|nr:hypothetical protein [Verrucomicrobiota bacterium]
MKHFCYIVLLIVVFSQTLLAQQLTIGEALDNTNVDWIFGYDADWFPITNPSYDGVDAARSGVIDDEQASAVGAYFVGPGTLSFWWKVSSEFNADLYAFFINGEVIDVISGETDWLYKEVRLPAETNLVIWQYSKDFVLSEGDDAAYLDQVIFTPDKVEPPALNIEKNNGSVKLLWKNGNTNFKLEETDDLNSNQWNLNSSCLITNQDIVYVVITNLISKKFYRLKLE